METLGRHAWEELAEKLAEMVIGGELTPGKRLVESELAARFGISRGPVRTALQHLERTGLVEVRNRRGVVVTEITARDVEDMYAVRIALERVAIDAICQQPARHDLTTLAQHVDGMEAAFRSDHRVELTRSDLAFHRALCELTDNRRLLRAWEPLSEQIRFAIGSMQSEDHALVAPLLDDHRRILDALTSEQPCSAGTILEQHLLRSRDIMIAHVRRLSEQAAAPA